MGIETEGDAEHKWQFQGQEKLDELEINYAHFKWRLHDPAIGRFISVDPLSEKYVHNSTYAFSENKVTARIELEGLEAVSAVMYGDAMHLKSATVKQKNEYYGGIAGNLLSLTDINDVTVLATTITRGNNAVNIDGTKASVLDKIFAAGGAAIPYVSGSAIKRVGNTIGEALYLTNNFVEGNKFWQKVSVFDNVKVFQRDDIFNPSQVGSWKENGKVITGNNIERMASGRAPVGNDGKQ